MADAAKLGKSLGRLAAIAVVLACVPVIARAAPGENELASIELATGMAAGGSVGRVSTSGNGRYLLFGSTASTLVDGDTNGVQDVFLRDRSTGITERISVGLGGMEANGPSWPGSISANGRYVIFESSAGNLVHGDEYDGNYETFLLDRQTGLTIRAPIRLNSTYYWPYWSSVSNDGEFAALVAGSSVYLWHFRWDGQISNLRWITEGYYPSISGNGRYVVFGSYRADLVPNDVPDTFDLFIWDRVSRTYRRVGQNIYAQAASFKSISRDGRWVAYVGAQPPEPGQQFGDAHAFLWDGTTGETKLVSVSAAGVEANRATYDVSVSDDGRYVAFTSTATNLAPGEDLSSWDLDVFIKDMQTGAVERVTGHTLGRGMNDQPALSDDGRFLGFNSTDPLLPADANADTDTFVHETGEWSHVPGVYDYFLRPRALDFGDVAVTAELKKGFTLSNSGSVPLPITVVEVLGVDRSQFALRSFCGSMVQAGKWCWIAVTFRPMAAGYKQASLHVVAGGIERHRSLRGTGVP